jgi:tetratricopeptide (TPR) repeat protein
MLAQRHSIARFCRGARFAAFLLATLLVIPARSPAQSGSAGRGAALFAADDYAAARVELEAALRRNPRDAEALYYLGRLALRDGRSSDAVDLFEKAIELNDASTDYHVWLGSALGDEAQRASKFRQPFLAKRVRTEFDRAVALDPRSVPARFGAVQVYALLPGFMGGNMETAHRHAAELAAVSPYHGHLAAAFLAQREKNFPAAEREYESAIAAAPDSIGGYLSLGALQQRQEHWDAAFASYDRLLARRPGESSAQFQIGRLSAISGHQLERGEQALTTWLAKPPKNASIATQAGAHHRLGQIYARTNRRDAARVEFEEAVRINPKNEDAKKSLAELK